MGNKIQNAHDRFFKSLMEDRSIAIAFLEEFLPQNVKEHLILGQLQSVSTTFISPELEEFMADAVFQVPLINTKAAAESCFISILLEHKSYIHPLVDFQILYYLAHSYKQQIDSGQKPQFVLPFLYYHGDKAWILKPLSHFFPEIPEQLHVYLPSFEKVFVSLNDLTEAQIALLRNELIRSAVMLQKHAVKGDQIVDIVIKILNSLAPYNNWNFTKLLIVYFLSVSREPIEIIQQKIKNMAPQIKSEILSTYDQAILQGKKEGKLEGKSAVVLNLYDAGMNIDFIMKVTELSKDAIEEIIRNREV
jgi:predicted transposase/invertase (TIGR01784 family)